jgi:hypothetical protein
VIWTTDFVISFLTIDDVRSIVLRCSNKGMKMSNTYDSWVNKVKFVSTATKIVSEVFWCSPPVAVISLVLVAMACITMTHS